MLKVLTPSFISSRPLKIQQLTKMKKKLITLGIGAIACFFAACGDNTPHNVMGYAPVYLSHDQLDNIASSEPQPIVNGGKIYVMGDLFFQVENGVGIHVLNISNPSAPEKMSFIKIPGAQEMSILNGKLYANMFNDLVVINITDPLNVKLISKTENVFYVMENALPPDGGYFECIDTSKGKLIGWEKKMLTSPKCKK